MKNHFYKRRRKDRRERKKQTNITRTCRQHIIHTNNSFTSL